MLVCENRHPYLRYLGTQGTICSAVYINNEVDIVMSSVLFSVPTLVQNFGIEWKCL